MAEAKSQQYVFSHEAIPELFHNDPHGFLTYLRRDKMNFLRFWWDFVGKNVGSQNSSTADGLDFVVRELDSGTTLAIITMPSPVKSREAYYLALILPRGKSGIFVRKDMTRVIALDMKHSTEGETNTVMDEITPRLKRVDVSVGPEPSLDAFKEAISKILFSQKI